MRIRLKQQRLGDLLATSGFSQNHWAIELGISRGHLADLVSGNHPYPSAKTRTRLLQAFHLSFEKLFEVETRSESLVDIDFRRTISDPGSELIMARRDSALFAT